MFIAYNYVNHKSNKKDAILLSIIKDKLDEQITFYISKRITMADSASRR